MDKINYQINKKAYLLLLLSLLLLVSCSQKDYLISGNIATNLHVKLTGNLAEILNEAGVNAEYVLLIASDGTAAFLGERAFPHINVVKKGGKYNTESKILPPVTGLYGLTEICVYNSNFRVENYQTPFSLKLKEFEFLGESSMNGYVVRKYSMLGRGD